MSGACTSKRELGTGDTSNLKSESGGAEEPEPELSMSMSTTMSNGKSKINANISDSNSLVIHSPILSSILPSSNIRQFESDVLKRQAEYSSRITDLEGRLALFHTRLAVECAERGREHALTMEEHVNAPIEQAMKRSLQRIETDFVRPIMDPDRAVVGSCGGCESREKQPPSGEEDAGETMEDESSGEAIDSTTESAKSLTNIVSVERQANLLEAQMNHHKHSTLFRSMRQNFDSIDQTCCHTIQPALALEMSKADKREGGMARRFESSSGEYSRLASEMVASRVSSLGYIEKVVDDWDIGDLKRAEHYLEEIRKLKARVVEAREERIRQDKFVVENIIKRKKMLEEGIYFASGV